MKSLIAIALALVVFVLGNGVSLAGEAGKAVKGQAPVVSAIKGQAPAPVASKGQVPEVKGQAPKGKLVANKVTVTESVEISDVQVVAVGRKRLLKGRLLAPAVSSCPTCANGTCSN